MNKSKYTDADQLNAWMDWKETCDIEKCSSDHKQFLTKKANVLAKNLLFSFKVDEEVDYAFSLFECYAINHAFTHRSKFVDKSYKDGLFLKMAESPDPPLKVVNGQFKCYLNNELKNAFFISDKLHNEAELTSSLDKDLNEDGLTLHDLLPASEKGLLDELATKELLELARTIAEKLINSLTKEEQALMACQYVSLKRSDPFVLEFLDTNSSHVTDVLNNYIPRKIDEELMKLHNEVPSAIATIKRFISPILKEEAFQWVSSEKSYEPLLEYMRTILLEKEEN